MEYNRRYRLVALLAAIGVLAGVFLFFHLTTRAFLDDQVTRERDGVVYVNRAREPDQAL